MKPWMHTTLYVCAVVFGVAVGLGWSIHLNPCPECPKCMDIDTVQDWADVFVHRGLTLPYDGQTVLGNVTIDCKDTALLRNWTVWTIGDTPAINVVNGKVFLDRCYFDNAEYCVLKEKP